MNRKTIALLGTLVLGLSSLPLVANANPTRSGAGSNTPSRTNERTTDTPTRSNTNNNRTNTNTNRTTSPTTNPSNMPSRSNNPTRSNTMNGTTLPDATINENIELNIPSDRIDTAPSNSGTTLPRTTTNQNTETNISPDAPRGAVRSPGSPAGPNKDPLPGRTTPVDTNNMNKSI